MNPKKFSRIALAFQSVSLALAAALAFGTSAGALSRAFAHAGGHDLPPPIDAEQALYNANSLKEMLVETKKLDKSWLDVTRESGKAEKRSKIGETDMEWIVTFSNGKEKDPKKKTLFIFLSLTGTYVAANHTGK